jgi:hypothetical protein
MPTGVYYRSDEMRANMIARVQTPEAKEKATAARKIARPRKSGYVSMGRRGEKFDLVHRIRAEKALGHPLPIGAEVHHPDEDKTNPNG